MVDMEGQTRNKHMYLVGYNISTFSINVYWGSVGPNIG